MEGELYIRSFEAQDQEQAHRLILQGLGEHFDNIDETLNPDLADILHNYIIPGHVFIVAYMGQNMVGTGALILHSEEISEMVRISTHRDYRRQGIGQAIITSLVSIARQRGNRRIMVKTNTSWHDAIRLYMHLGFVEYERTALSVILQLPLATI